METIKNYLDNMFMNLPKSREVQKAKEELLAMMEDKYSELKAEGKTENEAIGTVIAEFGNLNEVAQELNISGYLQEGDSSTIPLVSLEEAKKYIAQTISCSTRIAFGVLLCICSPIALIILGGMQEVRRMNLTGNALAFWGLLVLFGMVSIAVGLFIYNGMKLEKYEYLKKEVFRLEFSTDAYVKEEKERYRPTFAILITTGVVLCIMSALPIIGVGAFISGEKVEYIEILAVAFLLLVVSIAVFMFITAGMRYDCYKVLLQEEEYKKGVKNNRLVDIIAGIYWPLVTCFYLFWSFTTSDWGRTWIVWPIAGVLFGAIASICKIAGGSEK